MRIAYLIQAHEHPQLLARLVSRLQHPAVDFFIHIDSKSDQIDFKAALVEYKNVFFIQDRINIAWGGFAQVEASIRLIRESCRHGPYKYYILISGIDYPIRNSNKIVEFFSVNDLCFIDYFSAESSLRNRIQFLRRHRHYYLTDNPIFNPKLANNNVLKLMHRMKFISGMFFISGLFHNKSIPYKYYNGSNWWNLTHEVVDYLVHFLEENKWYIDHYKNTYCSDEMFFQTAILNSPLAHRVHPSGNNDSDNFVHDPVKDHSKGVSMGKGALRYIDWTKGRGHPAILDERDFDAIEKSGMLFARKIHPTNSEKLLDRIDSELLKYGD